MPADGGKAVALLLFSLFILIAIDKILKGAAWELLWLCHISLLIAAGAIIFNEQRLLLATLIMNLFVWIAWCVSIVMMLFSNTALHAVTVALQSTYNLYHLVFVPLIALLLRSSRFDYKAIVHAWLISCGIFLVLSILSFAFSNPMSNVNSAFYPLVTAPPIVEYATVQYLFALNVFMGVLFGIPALLLSAYSKINHLP